MRIVTEGSGPPLVLVHGWAMHGGVFATLAARLRAHRTLHIVDLPGHGLSRDSATPLQLDAVCDAIVETVPPSPWLGWSLGGLFALHAATRRPRHVTALAMLCASPRFVRADDWPYAVSAQIYRDFGAGLAEDYAATLERFVALEALGSDDARGELRALRAELFARGEPATSALVDGLRLLETTDLRAALPSLQIPSLWIAGRRDRLVDARAMRAAAALAPDARFVQMEHGGHAPFLTHGDEVAGALAGFLQGAEGQDP